MVCSVVFFFFIFGFEKIFVSVVIFGCVFCLFDF